MAKLLKTKDISFRNFKTNAATIDYSFDLRSFTIAKNDKNSKIVANINKNYAKQAEKLGYRGFSDEINSIHDPVSRYIYVKDNAGNLISNIRITLQTPDINLPIERGIIKSTSNKKYIINEDGKIAEINTFYSINRSSDPILYDTMVRELHNDEIDLVLVLNDPNNFTTNFLYKSLGFQPSKKYTEPIYFPTYGKKINNKFYPTCWNILELETRKMLPKYPSFLL